MLPSLFSVTMAEPPSARFEFPSMVYDMLQEVSKDRELSHIVSWMPHGRAFRVHKPSEFETKVMPKYFTERYNSFKYLLEQWGFLRLSRGKDRGAYYNDKFLRGQRGSIANATKQSMFETMPKYMSKRDEPNLYELPVALDEEKEEEKASSSVSGEDAADESSKADPAEEDGDDKSKSSGKAEASDSQVPKEKGQNLEDGESISKEQSTRERSKRKRPAKKKEKRSDDNEDIEEQSAPSKKRSEGDSRKQSRRQRKPVAREDFVYSSSKKQTKAKSSSTSEWRKSQLSKAALCRYYVPPLFPSPRS